jgi:sugar phosphate isomerase/epimerase
MSPPLVDHPHLVLAWGTVRYASFPDRVAAAAHAGFDSIGMAVGDYLQLRRNGWSDADVSAVLRSYGVTLDEVEILVGFFAPSGPADIPERPGLVYADPEVELTAFRMAEAFGTRRVQAIGTFDSRPLGPEVVPAFARLCDRAARHGLQVALEFVPYTSIPDLRTAARIVEEADRVNGGLCVDTWHFFRGDPRFEDLAAVDPSTVFMVQVNDGPRTPVDPNRMLDAVHHRRCPGEGDFALDEFVRAIGGARLDAAWSVEVYSDELDRRTALDAAELAASSTRRLLAAAGARPGPPAAG